jgi:hypothetical protein
MLLGDPPGFLTIEHTSSGIATGCQTRSDQIVTGSIVKPCRWDSKSARPERGLSVRLHPRRIEGVALKDRQRNACVPQVFPGEQIFLFTPNTHHRIRERGWAESELISRVRFLRVQPTLPNTE